MFKEFAIGPLTIHMYGLMMAVGFLSALLMTLCRGKKREFDEDVIWGIFFCALAGGLAGSKILYYFTVMPYILEDISILWDFQNGYVVYGGVIGGILCSLVYCRVKKTAFLPYFDLVMPAVSLAQGFGRIGCFLAGCCYGRETDAWYGVVFRNSDLAPNGVRLLPTQLFSSAGDFVICGLLLLYANRRPGTGRVAALYLILYGIGRFGIEFLRNDYRGSIGILSTSQAISVGIVAVGIAMYLCMPRLAGRIFEGKEG